MPAPQPNNNDDRLLRGIGRWALTAFAINLTVGSGILGLPARIQALVGNYSVPIIIACGLLMALIALCFAEVGSRFDRTGGPQLYASQALGSTVGFTVGWLLWISRIGSCAAVSNLAVDYGKVLWPQLAHPGVRALAITLLVLGYTWINIRGIRQTAAVNTTFTVLKIVPLVAFVAIGLFFVDPQALQLDSLPATDGSIYRAAARRLRLRGLRWHHGAGRRSPRPATLGAVCHPRSRSAASSCCTR